MKKKIFDFFRNITHRRFRRIIEKREAEYKHIAYNPNFRKTRSGIFSVSFQKKSGTNNLLPAEFSGCGKTIKSAFVDAIRSMKEWEKQSEGAFRF